MFPASAGKCGSWKSQRLIASSSAFSFCTTSSELFSMSMMNSMSMLSHSGDMMMSWQFQAIVLVHCSISGSK